MFFKKKINHKNAGQMVVEFALVAPILLLILAAIIEIGYAMSTRTTVLDASRAALLQVNNTFNNKIGDVDDKTGGMESSLTDFITTYLTNHNVPVSDNLNVHIQLLQGETVAVANIQYNYQPIFRFVGIPETIPLQTSQVINIVMLKENKFDSVHTTASLSAFNDEETGALLSNEVEINGETFILNDHIALLVEFYQNMFVSQGNESQYARLFSFYGDDILPPNLRLNMQTATLEVKSPYYKPDFVGSAYGSWFNTKIPYVWVLTALGYSHAIYTKYNDAMTDDLSADDSQNLHKLITNYTDIGASMSPGLESTYTKGIKSCGSTVLSGDCDDSFSGTATIQERALRFNPRLGANSADNSKIWATQDINSGTNWIIQNSIFAATETFANLDDNYYLLLNIPAVDADPATLYKVVSYMDLYENNITENPFSEPFRFNFFIDNTPPSSVGELSLAGKAVDIVDVYTDSDGDGIPDAWDEDPEYFDANDDCKLDGVYHHNIMMIEGVYIDEYVPDESGGVYKIGSIDPYISTPYHVNQPLGSMMSPEGLRDNGGRYLTPEIYKGQYRIHSGFLYYRCNNEGITIDDLCRKFESWWSLTPADRLLEKTNFINGSIDGTEIKLDMSPELKFLRDYVFNDSTRVTRVPPSL